MFSNESWPESIILMMFLDERILVSLCKKIGILFILTYFDHNIVPERKDKLELQTNFDFW